MPSSSGTPCPRKAPNIVAHKRQFVEQFPADLGHPVSRAKIFAFPHPQISGYFRASRPDKRGVSRVVTNAGRDAVDAAASGAKRVCRAVIREQAQRARRTTLQRTAKPCGPDTRGWCQAAGGEFDPTGSKSHQAGGDGGKTNSSPGRARHKPSNHCAGNAGVLRLYLYARVRSLCNICTRDRGCSKHPAFPAPSRLRERLLSKPRARSASRERRHTFSRHTLSRHHPPCAQLRTGAGDPVFQRQSA